MSEQQSTNEVVGVNARRFRKKPGEIEAMQWDGEVGSAHPIIQWVNSSEGDTEFTAKWREYQAYSSGGLFPQEARDYVAEGIYIRRAGSWREDYVGPNDWLILTADGLFQVAKADAFAAMYEAVTE